MPCTQAHVQETKLAELPSAPGKNSDESPARFHDAPPPGVTLARYVLAAAYCLMALVYFTWRLTVLNHDHLTFSIVFITAELIGFFWSLTFVVWGLEFRHRAPPAASPGLAVDVFVPTYNEPIDIIRRTLIAAMRIEYPHQTWLLDDGNRPEMRALAEELGCRYSARVHNKDAKAGNLNHGLAQSTCEFVAIFDADHIADPSFLDRTLGYFRDERLAFVQTPQEFYNFESYQHAGRRRAEGSWNEHSLFYRSIQRGRDRFNATMMCGCSAVLRRSALDTIGGFATGTVTEDMHTSVRLHAAGWNSVFHPETLSAGLAPLDTRSFHRQRLRCAQGAMQVFRKERLMTCSGLDLRQRISYLMHVFSHFEGFRNIFVYLLPALVLAFGLSPIDTGIAAWAAFTFPYFAVSILIFKEIGRGHGRFLRNEMFNLARCTSSLRAMRALLNDRISFWVTPKVRDRNHGRIGFLLPWIVLIATAAALLYAGFLLWVSRSPITADSFTIIALWATFSMATATNLCMLTRRCARNRRGATRFPAKLPMRLASAASPDATFIARVTAMSTDGLSLRAHPTIPLPCGPCTGTLQLRGEDFTFGLDLRNSSGQAAGGTLIWNDAAAHDRFDHALHVERIRFLARFDRVDHRPLIGPLARVLGWLQPVRRRYEASLAEEGRM